MKPVAIVLAALVLSAAPPPRELKVAVVNLKHCFDSTRYKAVQDAEARYRDYVDKLSREVEQFDKKIKEKDEELKVLQGVGNQDGLQLALQERGLLAYQRKMTAEFNQQKAMYEYQKIQMDLYNGIRRVIAEYAAAQGYDLVFKVDELQLEESSGESVSKRINYRPVLYHNTALDITDKVLEQLNAQYQKKGR